MSELEIKKQNIVQELRSLCAHCANNTRHNCQVEVITRQVKSLSGVPLMVNDRFNGVLLSKVLNLQI
jgi:hypothetical protein